VISKFIYAAPKAACFDFLAWHVFLLLSFVFGANTINFIRSILLLLTAGRTASAGRLPFLMAACGLLPDSFCVATIVYVFRRLFLLFDSNGSRFYLRMDAHQQY
jgi:hypothetical protein